MLHSGPQLNIYTSSSPETFKVPALQLEKHVKPLPTMIPRSELLLFYGCMFIVGWKLVWLLIHWVTGIYLGSITINNGILFNNISFGTKKLDCHLKSVRFRLWGNSRRLIIDLMTIEVKPSPLSKLPTTGSANSSNNNNEQSISPELPLIFPNNFILRILVKFLISRVPNISVELKHTTLKVSSEETFVAFSQFKLTSNASERYLNKVKFNFDYILTNLNHSFAQKITPITLANLNFQLTVLINLNDGRFEKVKPRISVNELKASVFNIYKYHILEREPSDTPKQKLNINRLTRIHRKLHPTISEISLHFENTQILEIPFMSIGDNHQNEDYFESKVPRSCLDLILKSTSFNLSKLGPSSAGFEVLFNPQIDVPFHLTTSIQLLKLNLTKLATLQSGRIGKQSEEILNVPNYSFSIKTNIFHHLATGLGFKNCVMEFFAAASSPILDLDTTQLSDVFYNIVLLKKWLKLKHLKRLARDYHTKNKLLYSEDTDEDNTNVEIDTQQSPTPSPSVSPRKLESSKSPLKERLLKLLHDFYPRLDIKLIIEQPRSVVRHLDSLNNKTQILNFSYSLLNFHLNTTESRNYDAVCHVLHPSIRYHEIFRTTEDKYNSVPLMLDIVEINHITFKFDILKNLKFKSFSEVHNLRVDLSKLDILSGINSLLNDITHMIEKYVNIGKFNHWLNSEIVNIRNSFSGQVRSTSQPQDLEAKLFRHLPSWLLESRITLTSINVILGSRSIQIPKEYLSDVYGDGLRDDYKGEHHNLRYIKLSLESIAIILNDKDDEDSGEDADTLNYDSPLLSSTNASLETLTSIPTSKTSYWCLSAKMTNFKIAMLVDLSSSKLSPFISLPSVETTVTATRNCDLQHKLQVISNISKLNLFYDRYKASALIGSIYLLREFVLAPFKIIKSKLSSDLNRYSTDPLTKYDQKTTSKTMKELLHINTNVGDVELALHLGDDFKVRFQVLKSVVSLQNGVLAFNNLFLRVLTMSPLVHDQWCRLLCIDSLKIVLNDPELEMKIQISTDSIRLMQPHRFVVHTLFDNISVSLKIAKHLLHCFKNEDNQKRNAIRPKESKTVKVPDIRLVSDKVAFTMDDDPFESKLTMIYQLGIIETRKRMEQLSLWESKVTNMDITLDEKKEKLEQLHRNMSTSWIRKVKTYKEKLKQEIILNKKHLFGNEALIDRAYNEGIVAYPDYAPLLSIFMNSLDLSLSTTKFDLDKLPQFLHKLGQGIPVDTKYSLMIPTFVDMKLDELRMHLRDYPLPLLYVPKNKSHGSESVPSLSLAGHLIIAEELLTTVENFRKLYFPLAPGIGKSNSNKFYGISLEKSLSSVKLFSDISCAFNSELPSRFVWGQSYQFGIQQIMLNFDQFSKPPVDPSAKLGFWDKVRLIMHGRCQIESPNNLEVAFKGSHDPYDLFGTSPGFILSFKDKIIWKINEHNDSRSFFDILSEKVTWYIPNYLGAPLVVWTRDTSKAVYMPSSQQFITSCFGYYLDSDQPQEVLQSFKTMGHEKNVVSLSGGVNFKVGFLLQRKDKDGNLTNKSKPHYDIKLFNPEYTSKGHDSYAGFRSDYIHMAISLNANNDASYNSIHLSPRTFQQFFKWWKLFASNMTLPIRRGKLFGALKESTKFSQHLFTLKFAFNFTSLFISHMYRDETIQEDENKIECIGIRAKMDSFNVDLHQRKEPRIQVHKGLSKKTRIQKMNFNIGEVHLSGIDLRVVQASFKQYLYKNNIESDEESSKYNIFDNDKQWFDIQDYEEAFVPSLRKCSRDVHISPLMFSKRFSYLRNTGETVSKDSMYVFGNEDTHECNLDSMNVFQPQIELLEERKTQLEEQIKKNKKNGAYVRDLNTRIEFIDKEIAHHEGKWNEAKKEEKKAKESTSAESTPSSAKESTDCFHNKFILINMFLKWNFQTRNCLLKYIHFVQLKAYLRKYLSYDSISAIEDIISKRGEGDEISEYTDELKLIGSGTSKVEKIPESTSKERLEHFEEILRQVAANESISEDYMIEIISPQIQLQSEDMPDSVVLIAAPNIDAKVVSVKDKSTNELVINAKELENRFGVVLKNANVFVLQKDDLETSNQLIVNKLAYGSKSNWPPWLGIEICKNGIWAGADKLIVEKTSMMLTYENLKPLGSRYNQLREGEDGDSEYSDIREMESGALDKLHIDFPKLVISSSSEQYFTLYVLVLSLLFYSEPTSKKLRSKLEKLKFSIDFQDLSSLHERLKALHKYHRLLMLLSNNYEFRQGSLSNEELNNYLLLNTEKAEVVTEIYLMMQTILSGDISQDSSKKPQAHWFIRADEIIFHMLEDDRTPILDIALAGGKYRRVLNEDGSDVNRLDIGMLQGFNLIPKARYQEFIQPHLADGQSHTEIKNLISADWTMNRTVGGIKIVEKIEISAQPLNVKIDEITGQKLMSYIFGSDSQNINQSPLISITHQNREQEVKQDGLDDSGAGFVEITDGINKGVTFGDDADSISDTSTKKKSTKKHTMTFGLSSNSDSVENVYQDQVDVMIERAKKFFSVILFKVNPISVMISISLSKGYKRLLNVQDFLIDLPEFAIQQRVLSFLEIAKLLQKLVIKVLLSHSGRLIRNKFLKKLSKKLMNIPLRPLKKYARFTQVSELREDADKVSVIT